MRLALNKFLAVVLFLVCQGVASPGLAMADDIPNRVYELTTFTTPDDRLGELKTQFRDHVTRLMLINGMQVVGLWTPVDEARSANTLIVMVSHESRKSAKVAWEDVTRDPAWKTLVDGSRDGGALLIKTEKTYLSATDFSPMK